MKKIIAVLAALTLLLSGITAFAGQDVTVTLGGRALEFDVPAQTIDSRTMVPMRKIFEELGATVDWYPEERGIVGIKGSTIIIMKVDAPMMVVANVATGEQKQIELDVPPKIVNSRTLVPVRAISESLGVSVNWVAETRTVELN